MRHIAATTSITVILATALTLPQTHAAPVPVPTAPPGGAAARADVNGDGVADIVMSSGARLTYSGDTDLLPDDLGGSVYVVPGGATLPSAPPVLVNQANPNVGTQMEADEKFGIALVTGDFNGDGLADVAVGNPAESVGSLENAGTVSVLYGQSTSPYLRLIPGALDTITQNTPEVPGSVEAGDLFGCSLAVGDFNADGYADLAVGSPGEAIGTKTRAGSVWVFYGGSSGLTTRGLSNFSQDSGDLDGAAEIGDLFGWSLAAGDVTGDGRDDLASLSAGEAVTGVSGAWGSVHLVPGGSAGLNVNATTSVGVGNASTTGRWRSAVIGRFHGGAFADVVISADQRRGAPQNAGALVSVRGGSAGVIATNTQTIDQNSAAMPGGPEANDYFGGSLAPGDVDGDGFVDLAVGIIREDGGAGAITLLRGGTAGLLSAPGKWIGEDDPAINALPQSGEGFAYGLRILDVTGDGKAELLATAPWEDFSLSSGTLFVIDIGLSGDTFIVAGSRRLSRADLGSVSRYGPAVPIAGGTVVLNDNQDSPR